MSLDPSLEKMSQPSPRFPSSSSRSALLPARQMVLVGGLLLSGCSLQPLEEILPQLDDQEIDPRSIFEKRVKPEMVQSCSCHQTTTMGIQPFLAPGMEYEAITGYTMGKFLTAVPEQSLLLTKGKHQGPAFTDVQFYAVRGWLDVESATRGLGRGSPTTPSVPIRDGDYFLAIDKFTKDPLSKITFTMKASSTATNAFVVSNLQITPGPSTGIKMKHPRFVFITAAGTTPDPSDALQTVDLTIPQPAAGTTPMPVTIGSGTLRMTGVPASAARVAMAFESIAPTVADPVPPMCKALAQFRQGVLPTLGSCAAQCHSPQATDRSAGSATGAFNMASALGTDMAAQALLCVYTLNRVTLTDIPKSPLIRQPQPVALGGTSNHPYKFPSDTVSNNFSAAVNTWASMEK